MVKSLHTIKAPIDEELKVFEKYFRDAMRSKVPLLDRITYYIVRRKGKQMRPMFVFLAAKISGGVKDATYVAASMIELLHTATLVHDDVVDESYERRGFFSINALWKIKLRFWSAIIYSHKGYSFRSKASSFSCLKSCQRRCKP